MRSVQPSCTKLIRPYAKTICTWQLGHVWHVDWSWAVEARSWAVEARMRVVDDERRWGRGHGRTGRGHGSFEASCSILARPSPMPKPCAAVDPAQCCALCAARWFAACSTPAGSAACSTPASAQLRALRRAKRTVRRAPCAPCPVRAMEGLGEAPATGPPRRGLPAHRARPSTAAAPAAPRRRPCPHQRSGTAARWWHRRACTTNPRHGAPTAGRQT